MKNLILHATRAGILSAVLAASSVAYGQSSVSTTTTTTSDGTISSFTPDAMVVRTQTSSTPVSYSFSKTTTYVDQNGNPVSVETVKSGLPVTVYYTQNGDQMVASRVVVRTAATGDPDTGTTVMKKTTTTTTSTPAP